jgi:bifunctional non-homologous end joining protein LigD
VALLTRTGLDWTERYPGTADTLRSLPVDRAYLDGELIGVRPDGTTSFALIQNASDTGAGSLVFFLLDLLHLDGEDLMPAPLVERKEWLPRQQCWMRGSVSVWNLILEAAINPSGGRNN